MLIVDDNSPDGTGAIVESIIADQPERVHILKRAGKQGLGTAYIAGFKWALERDYSYIIEMDADFSHPVDKLPELQRTCADGNADVDSKYILRGEEETPVLHLHHIACVLRQVITQLQVTQFEERTVFYPIRAHAFLVIIIG